MQVKAYIITATSSMLVGVEFPVNVIKQHRTSRKRTQIAYPPVKEAAKTCNSEAVILYGFRV